MGASHLLPQATPLAGRKEAKVIVLQPLRRTPTSHRLYNNCSKTAGPQVEQCFGNGLYARRQAATYG